MKTVNKFIKLFLVMLMTFTALFNFGSSSVLANETTDEEIVESKNIESHEKDELAIDEVEITTSLEDNVIIVEEENVGTDTEDQKVIDESEDSTKATRAGPTTREIVTVKSAGDTGYKHSGTAVNSGNGASAWFIDQSILKLEGNGRLGFCVEPWELVDDITGTSGYTPSNTVLANLDNYILHGYYLRDKSSYNYAVVTLMIWELGYGYVPSNHNVPNYQAEKQSILNSIANHSKRMSFNGQTITIRVGTPVTLTDTNGVLSTFTLSTNTTGVNVTKSGNTLTLTATADDVDGLIGFTKYTDTGMPTSSLLMTHPSSQDVYAGGNTDPITSRLNIIVEKYGSLEIGKKDNLGNYVPGVTFDLFYETGKNAGTKIGTYTTGSTGKVKIDEILPEQVKIVEKSVVAPLLLDSTPAYATIIINETVSYTKTNQRATGEATLKKVDKDTGKTTPLGEARLDNAVFEFHALEDIYDDITKEKILSKDQLIKEEVIGSDLTMTVSGLYPARYYFIEKTESTGYLRDNEKHIVDVRYVDSATAVIKDDTTSYQEVKRGNIKIKKFINTEGSGVKFPEFGAVFDIQLEKDIQTIGEENAPVYATITTNLLGEAEAKDLPWAGDLGYRVTQKKAANENLGLAPAWNSQIVNDGETISYYVGNELHTSYLQVFKYDKDLGEYIVIPTTFEIWDVDNQEWYTEVIGNKVINQWTTDETGMLITNKVMPAGNYELVETGVSTNYLEPDERVPFTITASNVHEVNVDGKPILVVRVSNQAPKGSIILNKLFERIDGLHDDEILISGWKVTYADHDVFANYDGETVLYKPGEQLLNSETEDGLFYATEEAILEMQDIYIGAGEGTTLEFEEVVYPQGYEKADNFKVNFKKDKDDNTTKVIEIEREVNNKIIRTDLEIVKKNQYTDEVVLGENFEFTMYADEELTQEIAKLPVDLETGKAKFDNLPWGFEGWLVETSAPETWFLSDEVIHVVINDETEGLGNTYSIDYYNKPVPTLGTKATHINESKTINPNIDNILIDDCDYTGIDTLLTYDRIWELRDSLTEEIILTGIENGVTFSTVDGTYRISVFVSAGTLKEGRNYYFAEYVKEQGKEEIFVEHNDSTDEGQTIRTEKPTLGTVATGLNGEKVFDPTIDNIMMDVVSYTGIDPNFVYDRVWELRESDTEKLALNGVEKDTTFDTAEGKYTITVTIPANTLKDGKSYYYVEKLIVKTIDLEGNEKEEIYVEHNDPKDQGQTIRMETPKVVETGDDTNILRYIGLGSFALVALLYGYFRMKNKNEDSDEE